jgi:hypothetical protein
MTGVRFTTSDPIACADCGSIATLVCTHCDEPKCPDCIEGALCKECDRGA